MKRQNRFIVALLAAGITFATLTATIGTDHWKRGHYYERGWYHHHHDYDHDHDSDGKSKGDSSEETLESQ